MHMFCRVSLSARLLNVLFVKDVIIGSEHHPCLHVLNFASCLSRVCLKCTFNVWSVVCKQLARRRFDRVCWKRSAFWRFSLAVCISALMVSLLAFCKLSELWVFVRLWENERLGGKRETHKYKYLCATQAQRAAYTASKVLHWQGSATNTQLQSERGPAWYLWQYTTASLDRLGTKFEQRGNQSAVF